MKKYFLEACTILLLLSIGTPLKAQELSTEQVENSINPNGKYAVFISDAKRLSGAVVTGEQLRQKSKSINFQIIMAGSILKELAAKTPAMTALVERAKKAHTRMVACEIAMKKMGIKKADLPGYIEVTSNAAIYIFGLEELGYKVL